MSTRFRLDNISLQKASFSCTGVLAVKIPAFKHHFWKGLCQPWICCLNCVFEMCWIQWVVWLSPMCVCWVVFELCFWCACIVFVLLFELYCVCVGLCRVVLFCNCIVFCLNCGACCCIYCVVFECLRCAVLEMYCYSVGPGCIVLWTITTEFHIKILIV